MFGLAVGLCLAKTWAMAQPRAPWHATEEYHKCIKYKYIHVVNTTKINISYNITQQYNHWKNFYHENHLQKNK